jgi:hypothetical protein
MRNLLFASRLVPVVAVSCATCGHTPVTPGTSTTSRRWVLGTPGGVLGTPGGGVLGTPGGGCWGPRGGRDGGLCWPGSPDRLGASHFDEHQFWWMRRACLDLLKQGMWQLCCLCCAVTCYCCRCCWPVTAAAAAAAGPWVCPSLCA